MDTYENLNSEEEKQEQLPQNIDTEESAAADTVIAQEETITEAPAAEEPIAEEPIAEEPIVEEPIVEKPPVQPRKKVSPYADSPYVMSHPVEQPVKPRKAKKAKKRGGFWKKALCAVLIIALVAGGCFATGMAVNNYWENRMNALEDQFDGRLEMMEEQIRNSNRGGVSVSGSPTASADGGLTPAQVYAQNVDAVVLIYNNLGTGTSSGSGFILNEEGYVVTNYHVVEGKGILTVVLTDGREYSAKLVGCDETNDVALLKIEAENLKAVTLGSSTDLIVGDQVVAIGNPLGELTSTLTVGYISAKERDVNTDGFAINMLQTDAAINSGNSGGPLFNMRGEVIGITTAKYSGTSSSGATIEGVGFAIPIDDVSGLLSDLATYGYVTGAYLGVSVSDMDAAAANYYGMPVGAYVQKVEKGFAAERAGIQPKDIITSIGGIPVENVNDLTRALRNFNAGDLTVVTIYRGGREMNLKITLDEKPVASTPDTVPVEPEVQEMPEGNFDEWYDFLAPFFGGKD